MKKIAKNIGILLLFLIVFSLYWENKYFGSVEISAVIFTLKMPLEGTSSSMVQSYFVKAFLPTVICFVMYLLFMKFFYEKLIEKFKILKKIVEVIKSNKIKVTIVLVFLFIVVINYVLNISGYIKYQYAESSFFKENYVNPKNVKLEFPKKKRNIIYIFSESAESSLQDKKTGGLYDVNYIPELTKLAKDNISFSQSNLLEGAETTVGGSYTMGGLVAQTSGIPIKIGVGGNALDKFSEFLPGAYSLGQILEKEGYVNYLMEGSDSKFSGKDKYFKQHGNYEIFDYYTAKKEHKISDDYYVWWGYEDSKLFEFAKEKLQKLAKSGKLFNFNLETVDTHHIEGYFCSKCKNKYKEQYANVWNCQSKQIYDFVEWIKKQDFYDNTTVVIAGDHKSMNRDFFSDFSVSDRKVYNTIINATEKPIKMKNRKFTTIDMYPTVLAAMGVKIDGNQLGNGVNLFSDKQTLAEKYGYEKLEEELSKKSNYYNDNILDVK